jgi:predicted ribosome quality control (RQC) complex YloA/Tae2 family protein
MKTISKYIDCINADIVFKIGQNAQDNFDMIDSAEPTDLWFHIDGRASLHVIVSIPEGVNKKQLLRIVTQGAVVCKQFSKYASEKKVEIIYAKIQDVVKTNVVGSVTLTKSKTIII